MAPFCRYGPATARVTSDGTCSPVQVWGRSSARHMATAWMKILEPPSTTAPEYSSGIATPGTTSNGFIRQQSEIEIPPPGTPCKGGYALFVSARFTGADARRMARYAHGPAPGTECSWARRTAWIQPRRVRCQMPSGCLSPPCRGRACIWSGLPRRLPDRQDRRGAAGPGHAAG
jgi:hypothetical protein